MKNEILGWIKSEEENLKNTGSIYVKGYQLEITPLKQQEIFDFWYSAVIEVVDYLRGQNFRFDLNMVAASIDLKEISSSAIYSRKNLTDIIDQIYIKGFESSSICIQSNIIDLEFMGAVAGYHAPVKCDLKKYCRPDILFLYEETLIEDDELDKSPDTRSLTIGYYWEGQNKINGC